jgi:hypothetical protein
LSEAGHTTHSAAELVWQLMRITGCEPDASPELVDPVAIVRDVGALLKRTLGRCSTGWQPTCAPVFCWHWGSELGCRARWFSARNAPHFIPSDACFFQVRADSLQD